MDHGGRAPDAYRHTGQRFRSIFSGRIDPVSCESLGGSLAISRKLYSSFEYEYSVSKVEKADRFFIELSYRF
jgi:hypothetical protein